MTTLQQMKDQLQDLIHQQRFYAEIGRKDLLQQAIKEYDEIKIKYMAAKAKEGK